MAAQMMSPSYDDLTQDFLKSVLNYDSVTGFFTWKDTSYSRKVIKIGARAEHLMMDSGHLAVDLFPRSFSASRLAILWETGNKVYTSPKHLNGDNGDNSIKNLYWKGMKPTETGQQHLIKLPTFRTIAIYEEEIEYLYNELGKLRK
jgi:hypothetical protein